MGELLVLRQAVGAAVWKLHDCSHREMTALAAEFGLPMPDQTAGSKRVRVEACLAELADDDLLPVAQRFLDSERLPVHGLERFALGGAM